MRPSRSASCSRIKFSYMALKDTLINHGTEIARLKAMLDLAFAQGAKASSAREDRVIFPLLVACRDIVEEVLFAVSEGFGRLALRSARTMYECIVFARHLSLYPEKTHSYLTTFHLQWAKVLRSLPDPAKNIAEVHNAVLAKVPAYAAGKPVDLKWSNERTLNMAKEAGIPNEFHAWAFDYASGFVHPSAVFLISHMSQASGGKIEIGMKSQDDEAQFALQITHSLILNAADLRLKYAPSDALLQQLEECKKDYANIWGYAPPI